MCRNLSFLRVWEGQVTFELQYCLNVPCKIVNHVRILNHHKIKPATSPFPASRNSKFLSYLLHLFSKFLDWNKKLSSIIIQALYKILQMLPCHDNRSLSQNRASLEQFWLIKTLKLLPGTRIHVYCSSKPLRGEGGDDNMYFYETQTHSLHS